MIRRTGSCALVFSVALGAAATSAGFQPLTTPTYTEAQAKRGKEAYAISCASCHGDQLDNGTFGPALAGPAFVGHWKDKSLDEPFTIMSTAMPPDNPGGLSPAIYADLMAFILSENGIPHSQSELPSDVTKLKAMAAPR